MRKIVAGLCRAWAHTGAERARVGEPTVGKHPIANWPDLCDTAATMDFAKLTQMSRQAMTDAQNLARRLNHTEVDTWHLFSALVAQENGIVPGLL
ncbi:MAG: Clp protease N-terminal domain-containing protein, partial [Opitutaceae bacterium]